MPTSVPFPAIGPAGFLAPDESVILTAVQADINAAFGGGLNPALETPQGQLASSITAIIGDCNAQFLRYIGDIDPATAEGRMQDGIARIYFLTREPALPTTVQCLCTGLAGVVIPAGALALATDGTIYYATAGGTISLGGSITLAFAATTTGPIACPAGSVTTIYRALNGWDTITNVADGVIGNLVENRADFEARRGLSVANNARGFNSAILGAVLSVSGVSDAFVTDNPAGVPISINGVTLVPHSLYVSVSGAWGTTTVGAIVNDAVGYAIFAKKPPGCDMNGNTTVTIADPNTGYSVPPTYQITYEIAVPTPIIFAVTIANGPNVPANSGTLIQQAIIAAFAGSDGGPRARIGSTIYASRFFCVIADLGSWARIVSLKISSPNTPTATGIGHIDNGSGAAGNILTLSGAITGAFGPGQIVTGPGIIAGTAILAQLTGTTGAAGTYTVNQAAQHAGAGPVQGVIANLDVVQMRVDQVPTIAPAQISVVLV